MLTKVKDGNVIRVIKMFLPLDIGFPSVGIIQNMGTLTYTKILISMLSKKIDNLIILQ